MTPFHSSSVNIIFGLTFVLLTLPAGYAAVPAGKQDIIPLPPSGATPALNAPGSKLSAVPRLESALNQMLEMSDSQGISAARSFARENNIALDRDRVQVELTLQPDAAGFDDAFFSRFNVEIISRSRHFIHLNVPLLDLAAFAQAAHGVISIHRPIPAHPIVTSEGVGLTGADDFHTDGSTGAGVDVAVVDIGFATYANAQANGELPAQMTMLNFTGEPMANGDKHGAACTEIVYDMAPGANFTIAKIATDADMENAVDSLIARGVDVISMSLGWLAAFGDYFQGGDPICAKVNEANAQGILFAVAAGNDAKAHYRAGFNDQGQADNYHRFADGVTVDHFGPDPANGWLLNNGTGIWVYMAWDAFPTTDQDLDLYLVRWNGQRWIAVAQSITTQDGDDPPEEYISFTVNTRAVYGVIVHNYDADDGADFTLLSTFDFAYYTSDGSIGLPALAQDAFAVGAIDQANWNDDPTPLEEFSSQGPTYDGRTKPEISGPDGVTSFTYGGAFYGTSAATPHVAGTATLLKSAYPLMTNADLRGYLQAHAVDIGDPGQDNMFGYGKLNMELIGMLIEVPNDYQTIQGALNAAAVRDTVLVHPGAYPENLIFPRRGIILGSRYLVSGNQDDIANTIIDGGGNGATVRMESTPATARMVGFTITGGTGKDDQFGGGIFVRKARAPVEYCVITGNSALGGGGVYLNSSTMTFNFCTISGNSASSYGGGMAMISSTPTLNNCVISGNTATQGAGLRFYRSSPTLNHCQITGNDGTLGGGNGGGLACVVSSNPTLNYCTISDNSALRGGAIWCYIGSHPTVSNSIMWNDSPQEVVFKKNNTANGLTVSYTDIKGDVGGVITNGNGAVTDGGGNINSDPFFADPPSGDYHLTESSPCIDAADPDGSDDPDGTQADMGAYFYNQGGGGLMSAGDPGNLQAEPLLPKTVLLSSAYPNPFNAATTIRYALPTASPVKLAIFDLTGRLVTTLAEDIQPAGNHTLLWNAQAVPAGSYYLRFESPGLTATRRLMLIK